METLRDKVYGFSAGRNEKFFIGQSLGYLLKILRKIPRHNDYETKRDIDSVLSNFSIIFLSCLAILRSGQPRQRIAGMEATLKTQRHEAIRIQFLENTLSLLCAEPDKTAIEIAAFSLYAYNNEVAKCARVVLEKSGQKSSAKDAVAEILRKFIPGKSYALSVLANVNTEIATERAVELLTNPDEQIQNEAVAVMGKSPLDQEVADRFIAFLKSHESKALWKNICHREIFCDFIKRAFEEELIPKEEAIGLIAKAFRYERLNRGIRHILAAAEAVDPKNKHLLLSGFLAMEKRNDYSFSSRKESVEKFVSGLKEKDLLDYLKKTLQKSNDREFCWFAGQRLIAADIDATSQIFVEIAKTKELAKIGTLAQLAMKVCHDDKFRGAWESAGLNKKPTSRFAPVAHALLDYAESDECPSETRLSIAYQPAMYGSSMECCRRAIPLLGKVMLAKESSSENVWKALQALFNARLTKRGFAKEVDPVLKNIYESPRRSVLLEQMLFILTNDIRGDIMEPLYPAIVGFLLDANKTDSVPILKKALHAEKPNGDLGMCARQTYIMALGKIASRGSKPAISAIAGYCKGNTWGELIPAALAEIYEKTPSQEIKDAATLEVAERFLLSIKKAPGIRIMYFHELKAVEALKGEPLVQKAFLDGIAAIADIGHYRSAGMCNLIKRVPTILPKEKMNDGRETLIKLMGDLDSEKSSSVAEYEKGGRSYKNTEYMKTIDAISAEIGLTLTIM